MFSKPKKIHFLNVGKNAGTQLSRIFNQLNELGNHEVIKHSHQVKLDGIPGDEDFCFSIRSPEKRFMSGFYSRKGQGQSRIYSEWSRFEVEAFQDFEHANDLAEALFAPGALGLRALCAIKSISHNAEEQISWFNNMGYFLRVRVPLMIFRQEHLNSDIKFFFRLLMVDDKPDVITDPIKSHRNDYSQLPPLSEKALQNLQRWYAQDYEFYEKCCYWLARQFPGELEGLENAGVAI